MITPDTKVPLALIPRALTFLFIIMTVGIAVAQQPHRKIARIEVEGLQRLSADDVIAATGLKTGTDFFVDDIDAAGQKLVESGLFSKVGYKTRSNGNQITVIFIVEEIKGSQSPVVFDNFVWFTDDELMTAIRREVPSYTGTAPDAGNMTDLIKTALQKLLDERKIEGTVEYAPWLISPGRQEHMFSVSGVPIPICKLSFPGSKNISEEKLVLSSKQLTEADYSVKSAVAFGNFILFPLYREVGQLRAKFGDPIAKFENSEKCKAGVNLSIPVDEGPIYRWNKAVWVNNQVLTTAELDEALGMKPGEVANGVKIDRALIGLAKAYGRKGHLELRTKPSPEFDDAGSQVTYRIELTEGPRYTMGRLLTVGLSESESEAVQYAWKLKPAEVFDTSYIEKFMRTDGREVISRIFLARQAAGKAPPRVEHKVAPNRQNLTADVTIEFKD